MALTVWLKAGHTVAVISDMAHEFERSAGIELDIQVVPEEDAHDAIVSGRSQADVVTVPFWYLEELLAAEALLPATLPAGADYHPTALSALTREGKLWAVPHTLTGSTLAYRGDLLRKFDLEVPRSPSGLLKTAAKLRQEGYMLAVRANPTFSSLETYSGWAYAKGVRLLPAQGIPSPQQLEDGTGDLVAFLRTQSGGLEHLDYAGAGDLIVRGRSALLLDTSAWSFLFEAPDSPMRGKIGYTTLAAENPVQFTYAEGLGVTRRCTDPSAAQAFIAWRHSEAVVRRELEEVRRVDLPRLDLAERDWYSEFIATEELEASVTAVRTSWAQAVLDHVALRPDYVKEANRLMRAISETIAGYHASLTDAHAAIYGNVST